jgi:hypothetical protein
VGQNATLDTLVESVVSLLEVVGVVILLVGG